MVAVQLFIGNLWQVWFNMSTQSRRFYTINFIFEGHSLHLVNMNFPTDYHGESSTQQMRDTQGELDGFDYLMIGGNWNTDFGRTCDLCPHSLLRGPYSLPI